MSNTFNEITERIKNSPFIWLIFLLFVGLFVISIGLFVEDFTTSLRGYQDWPTAKANAWVVFLVAILPQLGQVTFAYAYIDKRQPEMLIILVLFFFWDLTTDAYYKSYQFRDPTLTFMAVFESVVLFTLGSELLMAFSLGMVHSIWGSLKQMHFRPRQTNSQSQYPKQSVMPTPPPSISSDRIFSQRPRKD